MLEQGGPGSSHGRVHGQVLLWARYFTLKLINPTKFKKAQSRYCEYFKSSTKIIFKLKEPENNTLER